MTARQQAVGAGALTPEQRVGRRALIDAANERMGAEKRAALEAYARVHPFGHRQCSATCREAHQRMLESMADANARYQSGIGDGQRA